MIIKNRDRFNDLPREITVDILSRLPARSIMKSKCVCKAWRYLVQSPEFGPLHASRAALSSGHLPAIEDLTFSNITYSLLGYIEDNEVIQNPPNGLVLSHKWPNPNSFIHSSVNGLLFMINLISASELFICNPITREYVTFILECDLWEYAFGFGVSKSGQHKFVMISQSQNTCQVYTLGTGQWKSIAIGSQFEYDVEYKVVFVNGNLACDFEFYSISDLEGLLCFSDDTSMYEIEIWCMKEYGDDKSWTLDYVIKRPMFTVEIGHILHYIFRLFLYPNNNLISARAKIAPPVPTFEHLLKAWADQRHV
ncbi:putative F-box protein At1g53370 [Salvia hispanica]|uniref:putative F-box protein At1g53370 n=1 Tax=Salvia hispanica TaxID=49212 RepID=UPI002009A8C6|nr:putative F-box protein At1g53370 [Salvia hispanica]